MKTISRSEAKAKQLTRYFTGEPCKEGHVCERFTASYRCCNCEVVYRKENVERIRETVRKSQSKYRKENQEEVRRKDKEYKQKQLSEKPELKKNNDRRYYERHKEKILANRKPLTNEQRKKRADASSKWRKENPDKVNFWLAKRRASKQQAIPNWITETQLTEIQDIYTKASESDLEVDHIVPIQGGNVCGLHVPWNLQTMDSESNNRKGNREYPDMW